MKQQGLYSRPRDRSVALQLTTVTWTEDRCEGGGGDMGTVTAEESTSHARSEVMNGSISSAECR